MKLHGIVKDSNSKISCSDSVDVYDLDHGYTETLYVDGRVYDYANLLGGEDNTPEIYDELDGNFALVVKTEDGLQLVSDRFSTHPLFYRQDENQLYFSDNIFDLADFPELDLEALVERIMFGHALGKKTVFSGIRLLPPGSILETDGDETSVKTYWDYRFGVEDRSFESTVVKLKEKMKSSTAKDVRETKGEMVLGLSGGFDSRFLAAYLSDYSDRVDSASIDPMGVNFRYANQVADVTGLDLNRLTYDHRFLEENLKEFILLTNTADHRHIHNYVPVKKLADNYDYFVFGHGGDELFKAMSTELGHTVEDFLHVNPEIVRDLLPENEEDLVDKALSNFQSITKHSSDPIRYFWLSQMHRRWLPCFIPARYLYKDAVFPLMDNELVDLVTSTPVEMLGESRRLERAGTVVKNPELGKIPNATTRRPLRYRGRSRFRDHLDNLKDSLRDILMKVSFGNLLYSPSHVSYKYDDWIRKNPTFYRGTIENEELFLGLDDVFERHVSGREDNTMLLSPVFTITTALSMIKQGH